MFFDHFSDNPRDLVLDQFAAPRQAVVMLGNLADRAEQQVQVEAAVSTGQFDGETEELAYLWATPLERLTVERTTQHLMEVLGDDIDRCHAALIDSIDEGDIDADGSVSADYEHHARNLIRAVIAYIEAVTFSAKVYSVNKCLESGIDVTEHERYLTVEIEGKLNEKGEIFERPAKIRLAQNVRFAFRLLEKANGQPTKFDPSEKWWSCFKETIRVRDRLAHPRMADDIDVSGDDIISALEAKNGFSRILVPDENE